ncbi:hypothetical protein A3K93_14430 (plasmid) [Acinetobacter sp. NCu2D-2]|uniref:hypothetical protein n=1 Tax=Acinetobacter sp. NCu2D-2 TaxID=1608473 RepID=UPI0007CDD70A|nr:hypothetical protein [Acinetobacter sp. NCu2D-2]ANF83420.1 hypothetical protein A3K93_14430 [Acinetobacter sp. NCu2D-2]
MMIVNQILGLITDHDISHQLHDVSHHGVAEKIVLSSEDISRHRLKVKTNRGRDVAIQLPRHQHLQNGSVLHLASDHAIWVEVDEPKFLSLKPKSIDAALELGYFAGNMHWPIRFKADVLQIQMQSHEAYYLERLAHFIESQTIEVLDAAS